MGRGLTIEVPNLNSHIIQDGDHRPFRTQGRLWAMAVLSTYQL